MTITSEVFSDPGVSPILALFSPGLVVAVKAGTEGVYAERKKNYAEAVRLYRKSQLYFHYSIKYEMEFESTKIKARNKCKEFADRVELLEEYLKKKQAIQMKMKKKLLVVKKL